MKIHHIGYLVKNIEEAMSEFHLLGYQLNDIVKDDIRGINICFIENGCYKIELISPFRDDSVVSGLMKKYKNTPYHICYETNNINNKIKELSKKGYVQM